MSKRESTHDGAAALDRASGDRSLTAYFTAPQWSLYAVIVVVGLLLRWILLDMRPYHHDESLHGMYGRYFYDFPENSYYKYDPMLHGPMLYNSMRFIYAMFGDSLWAARTPVCLMGSLFMFVPLLYRRFFCPSALLILTAGVAFSPTLVYWSRFLREDYWVVSGMLFTLYGFTVAPRPWKAFFVFFGIVIQWCTKENIFVTLSVFAGYPLFEIMFNNVVRGGPEGLRQAFFRGVRLLVVAIAAFGLAKLPPNMLDWKVAGIIFLGFLWFIAESILEGVVWKRSDSAFASIGKYMQENGWQTILGFVASALIFCWFYGAGFRYPDGILSGLGGKAIDYWAAHHAMERIKGPFNFHLYVMGWYEFPVFLAFLTHLVLFYRRTTPEIRYFATVVATSIVLAWFYTDELKILENPIWKPFKLKDNLDIVGLFVLLFHAPLVTIHHLLRREKVLAAAGYFFTATFFVYSYLGEKVPWLSMYPLIFGLPYLTLFFQDYFKNYPVDYKNFPVKTAVLWTGIVFMALGLIFWAERKPNDPSTNEDFVIMGFGVFLTAVAVLNLWGNYLGKFNVGRWIAVGAALFCIRAAVQTNYLYGGKETEYLSQVHSTYDVAEVAKQIVDEVLNERDGYKPMVFVTGEATWPLAWYFRYLKESYKFQKKPEETSNFTYLFIDWKDKREPGEIPEGYTARKMNLRGWWVPDFRQITLKKFLRYSINHYPWNTSGFTYTTLLVAKDTSRFKN